MRTELTTTGKQPGEDFEEFFNESLCGFVLATPGGIISRINKTLGEWLGCESTSVVGKNFSELLAIGGRIYYETHLSPLLKMQGFFDEIALELSCQNLRKLPVLINALEVRNKNGEVTHCKFTVLKATDRRTYEQNLKEANQSLELSLANARQVSLLREQFIAILGHDLRNPLGSITAGASMLAESNLSANDAMILQIISRSAARMAELITNIMDFARTRLGEGIIINPKPTLMEPVLQHVADELITSSPGRNIRMELRLPDPVTCDAPRIAQVFSNLLSNAIAHGSPDQPVEVIAAVIDGWFEIEVCNGGIPIPAHLLGEKLFEPFSREMTRPSRNGLGLGLYIVSQIAKAHRGEIKATSTAEKTCFTFRMKTAH